jgi:hypothetical protein
MPSAQNSPRGRISKKKFASQDMTLVGNTTGWVMSGQKLALAGSTNYITENTTGNIILPAGLAFSAKTSNFVTQNSTGVKLPQGLALSGKTTMFTANSTCPMIWPVLTAIPTTRVVGGVCFVSNSTGKRLAFHSTGTTWKYLGGVGTLA